MVLKPKPVAMHNGKLHWINHEEAIRSSFLWNFPENAGDKVPGLVLVAEIETQHPFSYPGFFKPSIQEVWNQIPELFNDTDLHAFETKLISTDLNKCMNEDRTHHLARTRLYKIK